MRKITILSSAIILSLTVNVAIAGPGGHGRPGPRLMDFDTNQDGSITGDEVQAVLTERFTVADTDGDGLLTQDEMSIAHEQLRKEEAAKRFAELDTDGNGLVSLEEFQATMPSFSGKRGGGAERMFSRLDQDGDGSLSEAEMSSGPFADKHSDKAERMFSRLDQDGDGLVSSTEMNTPVVKMFERLDADGDGVISSQEMNRTPFGHRGGGHHGR
jgi:Ca2+-binding EF-hand superfamily protein